MSVDPQFWRGKRVFVTGHTGFKGGWLALWLKEMGARVAGYALAPATDPSFFAVCKIAEGMASEIADIRDGARLADSLARAEPEIVLHLASQPLVRRSYEDPVETYSTNVLGLVHLFEAARRAPSLRVLVNVTSDKCYENREWHWGYRESEPMGGYDPYSSSKGCAELVTSAYRRSFFAKAKDGVALASARAGNVIGGGDWNTDRLVPDLIKGIEAGKTVVLRSPDSIRPWQHVLEPLSGYLVLAQALWAKGQAFAEGWNFGPTDADCRTVREIAEALLRHSESKVGLRIESEGQPHEAKFLKLDCSLAAARLGWRPRWSVDKAIERTVAWHRGFRAGQDPVKLAASQIAEYAASART
jgi:CDP-glucose 4,6-dehydratase